MADSKLADSKKDKETQSGAPDNSEEALSFEGALAELEALVSKMEEGELTLDESLKAFERGVVLARQCQTELANAELKVQSLTEAGELEALPDHNA